MAIRPVYLVNERNPFYMKWDANFVYNKGLAPSQKKKNIQAIHETFSDSFPEKKVLEISSKSMQEGGKELSAFFLPKMVPSIQRSVSVENVYQAGKVFTGGGPFTDLLTVTPREAKTDPRLKNSGKLIGFQFEGKNFPTQPESIFYDFLYINALFENKKLAEIALKYDAFTDIEFNPQKSVSCQAKAAAVFVSLSRQGLIEKVRDFEEFIKLFSSNQKIHRESLCSPLFPTTKIESEKPKMPIFEFSAGDVIEHKTWGRGIISKVEDSTLKVKFDTVGEKDMGREWVAQHCKINSSI